MGQLRDRPGLGQDIALVIRGHDGRILDANRAAEVEYGYSRAELLALSIFDLRTDGNRILAAPQMAIAETRPVRFETIHRRKDGSTFRVVVSSRGTMVGEVWALQSSVRRTGEAGPPARGPGVSSRIAASPDPQDRPARGPPSLWTPELALGIEPIDSQHMRLCQAVADLREAMKLGRLSRVPAVIQAIERYAAEHFSTEQAEMERAGYPGRPAHRELHRAFAAQLVEHQAALGGSPRLSAVVNLSSWLTHWMGDHLRGADAELGRFLRAQRPGAVRSAGRGWASPGTCRR